MPLLSVLLAFVAAASAGPPRRAFADSEVIAPRGNASALTARYGRVVPAGSPAVPGPYLAPTGTGVEYRHLSLGGGEPLDVFRTAGAIHEAVAAGNRVYLLAGARGVVELEIDDLQRFVPRGSYDVGGPVEVGAYAPLSSALAAGSGASLHFFRDGGAGALAALDSRTYNDGRTIRRILARSDTFLVASTRALPIPGAVLTLFRVPAGAAPESLWEARVNNHAVEDAAWNGTTVFLADGNQGVLRFDLTARAARFPAMPVASGKFVRGVDVSGTTLVAVTEARTFAQYALGGPTGDSLTAEATSSLTLEPRAVAIIGGQAIASTEDLLQPADPDESSRGLLEPRDLGGGPPPLPLGGTGRTRRVVCDAGLAYVADYGGGLRIYRAAGPDTSLVGGYAVAPSHRVYDVALDRVSRRAYLAAGAGGLTILDITDPSTPSLLGSLGAPTLPGFATAVAVVDAGLVVVGRRGTSVSGVTFVDVTDPSLPFARGSVGDTTFHEPRAIAVRDTIAFVADALIGVVSVRFGNPDVPGTRGRPSGAAALDLDLVGTRLVVGTSTNGVQIVDAAQVTNPLLLSQVPTPPVTGVAQQGGSVVAMLGSGGAMVVDMTNPARPAVRGPIAVPGAPRDAAWVGDTLLVAASYSLERFVLSPAPLPDAALTIDMAQGQALPRARVRWAPVSLAGVVGLNLFRDEGRATEGETEPLGTRVNSTLLASTETEAFDGGVLAGREYRYRLEAFLSDGSSLGIAEGSISVPPGARVGRPFPNPYRARAGARLSIPFQVGAVGSASPFRVRVFSASGRLVHEASVPPPAQGGFVTVTWDGRDRQGRRPASGIYFVQVRGPGLDATRPIALFR